MLFHDLDSVGNTLVLVESRANISPDIEKYHSEFVQNDQQVGAVTIFGTTPRIQVKHYLMTFESPIITN